MRFVSATTYELYYRDDPAAPWVKDSQTGNKYNSVFQEAKAFILANWWTRGIGVAGDKYRFSADPHTEIVEIPVLFKKRPGGADAFTSNSINALVDGWTIFTPQTYGPAVDYTGGGASDILEGYVTSAFGLCGYTDIRSVDVRYYHDLHGSIHCLTNTIRSIPLLDWWQFLE